MTFSISQMIVTSFAPGADVSDQPQEVQGVAAAVWTEQDIADYQAIFTVE